jgi:hypothetical protein
MGQKAQDQSRSKAASERHEYSEIVHCRRNAGTSRRLLVEAGPGFARKNRTAASSPCTDLSSVSGYLAMASLIWAGARQLTVVARQPCFNMIRTQRADRRVLPDATLRLSCVEVLEE